MANVSNDEDLFADDRRSDEELSVDDRRRRFFEPLTSRSWNFYHRSISQVEPMEPADFLHMFRCRLNFTRQCRFSHHNNSLHPLMLFEWHLDVMVHHGAHIGITSGVLSDSHLMIALRRYEKWAKGFTTRSTYPEPWDAMRVSTRRMRRRLLRMSQQNSRNVGGG